MIAWRLETTKRRPCSALQSQITFRLHDRNGRSTVNRNSSSQPSVLLQKAENGFATRLLYVREPLT